MKRFKIISILFVLLLLDLTRPLGVTLNVDFLFLGIIFLAVHLPLKHSLPIALIFGYARDAFMPAEAALGWIELPLICLGMHYFFGLFLILREKADLLIKMIGVLIALAGHILFLFAQSGNFPPSFAAHFFLQSFLVYFILEFFFYRWIFSCRQTSLL